MGALLSAVHFLLALRSPVGILLCVDFVVVDSTLLEHRTAVHLSAWIDQKTDKPPAWRLLYRATRDGFVYEIAKGKINDHGPTFTVAKFADGQSLSTGATLIGGYASNPWKFEHTERDDGLVKDPKAFIFTADSAGSASALLKFDVTHVRHFPKLFPYFCTPKDILGVSDILEVDFDIEFSEAYYCFAVKKPDDHGDLFTTVEISELEIFAV